jgi:hypothetical protein
VVQISPPDDPLSQIGPPPPPASISTRNCANFRTYSLIWQFLDSPFENHRKSPRLPPGNVPASNATCLGAFWHRSEPVSSIPGPRHGVTVSPCSQDPPASKSTRIDAFSRVSHSISPRTGPPHLSAPSPTCSEVVRLDFEPNSAISTPGQLSYPPDDESSSPFAPAISFQPETAPMHPRSLSASETTRFALLGGNHHHPAISGPTRTNPSQRPFLDGQTWP